MRERVQKVFMVQYEQHLTKVNEALEKPGASVVRVDGGCDETSCTFLVTVEMNGEEQSR